MKKIISLLMILTLIIAASSISFTAYKFEKTMDDTVDETSAPTLYIGEVDKKKSEENTKREEVKKANEERKEALKDDEDEDDEDESDDGKEDDNDTDEIKDLKRRVQEIKVESMKLRNEIRKAIRKSYSAEELAKLEVLKLELMEEYEGIQVLDIDSIISNSAIFKFDTPPVIKDGRTLLPVSAITKGIGADIEWIADEKKIIITKGEDVIELWIDNNIALVNGVEVELDASPELMNSRTIVPLRFIVETFNFKVEWNPEDETIEIIDENTIEDETVSGASTDVTVSGASTDVTVSGAATDIITE